MCCELGWGMGGPACAAPSSSPWASDCSLPAVAQTPALPYRDRPGHHGRRLGPPGGQVRRGGLPAQWLGLQVKPAKNLCFTLSCTRLRAQGRQEPRPRRHAAARFIVKDGDNPFGDAERAEVQGAITGRAGTIRWYTWLTYLPPGFRYAPADDDRWLAFTQFAVGKGSPPRADDGARGPGRPSR